jgi:hypothetical protein
VLCQLSYSHRLFDYSNCAPPMSETHIHSTSPFPNQIAVVLCKNAGFSMTDDLDFPWEFANHEVGRLAPAVGVITPQLESGATRSRGGE